MRIDETLIHRLCVSHLSKFEMKRPCTVYGECKRKRQAWDVLGLGRDALGLSPIGKPNACGVPELQGQTLNPTAWEAPGPRPINLAIDGLGALFQRRYWLERAGSANIPLAPPALPHVVRRCTIVRWPWKALEFGSQGCTMPRESRQIGIESTV